MTARSETAGVSSGNGNNVRIVGRATTDQILGLFSVPKPPPVLQEWQVTEEPRRKLNPRTSEVLMVGASTRS